MKTFAFVLFLVVSTALAAPMEDRESEGVKGLLSPFFKSVFHHHHRGPTSTIAPEDNTDDGQSVPAIFTPSEETSTSDDEMVTPSEMTTSDLPTSAGSIPSLIPIGNYDGITDSGNVPAKEGADIDLTFAASESKDEPDCCFDKGIHEQAHAHDNVDSGDGKDQQEEEPAESQVSYDKVIPDTIMEDIPVEAETSESDNKPDELSRELKPPHQESTWGDAEQKDVEEGEVKTVEQEQPRPKEGESREDDTIYKKPIDSGRGFIKGGSYSPTWSKY